MEIIASVTQESGSELCRVSTSVAPVRKNFYMVHKHASLELSLITGGKGSYRTARGCYPIAAGDLFLYSANEQHCISDASDVTLLNIHFSPRFFWDAGDGNARFLDVYFNRGEGFRNRVPAGDPAAKAVGELLLEILGEARKREQDYAQVIRAKLLLALVLLYRTTDFAERSLPPRMPGGESLGKISRALDYIDAHYLEPITLGDISERVHLARTYFAALFKASYGMTTWDYINIRRIDLARRLLCETDETVLAVALRCGFNNTANFNRVFRRVTATTPTRYRAEKSVSPAAGSAGA